MADYKIVVRSFGRSHMIRNMTPKFLQGQKDLSLKDCLYFVVHESELALYEEALQDVEKAGFIVKKSRGGNESIRAAREYFPDGTPILFMDDDVPSLLHYRETPTKSNQEKLDCLGAYIEDAFKTLSEIGAESWSISNARNFFWISGKPWKEFRPHLIIGGLFGAFNSDLLLTRYSHEDDQERSSRYIDHFGGSLIYNWVIDETIDERLEGGMQLSPDRASVDRTRVICEDLWENDEAYRKFHSAPEVNKYLGLYTAKLKNLTQIRKLRPFRHRIWSSFFSPERVELGGKGENSNPVLEMFGS